MRALTNSSGSVVNTYTYDAYGNTTASTGTVANPFKYSGQYTDSESGFLYLRARYYDPATQQFLSVDPMLASTEQAYNYVGGSPVNGIDPSGLDANCSWWPNPFDEHSCMREGFDTPAGKWVVVGGAVAATGGIACVAGGCEALAGAAAIGGATAAAPEAQAIESDLAPTANELAPAAENEVGQVCEESIAQVQRSLTDPASLAGADVNEVRSLIPSNWTHMPANTGIGDRWFDPLKGGADGIRIMYGDPNAASADHQGWYAIIARNGEKIRVLLTGAPPK